LIALSPLKFSKAIFAVAASPTTEYFQSGNRAAHPTAELLKSFVSLKTASGNENRLHVA
jgi:hypothetical protein